MTPWQSAPWTPRRWQSEALGATMRALREGRRPIIRACTGAGKSIYTAEVCWLAVQRSRLAVLVVPTEALVEQSAATLRARGDWTVARWYGRVHESGDVYVCCYPSLSSLLLHLAETGRTIDVLVCDECHGTEAAGRQADIEATEATWRVGVTATPYRADEAEALTLWDGVAYEYGTGDAIADGVLVPVRLIEPDAPQGTLVDDALDQTYRTLPTRPDTGRIRPGVVSAASVEDAEQHCARLRQDGWRAETVHYRRSRADIDDALSRLQSGALDMLVHVSMLSEGVDLPWLWWVALRRPLGSRVALVQTVGRVVRPDRGDPAKTEGIVIDPHGLCASVGLIHEAAIGPSGVIAESDPRGDREPSGDAVPMVLDGRRIKARASDAERRWRELAVGLEVRGLIPPGMSRGRWTRRPASDRQRAALGRLRFATRHLPEVYRDPWRALADHPDLTAGCASDLMTIACAAADGGREARAARRAWHLDLEPADVGDTDRTDGGSDNA